MTGPTMPNTTTRRAPNHLKPLPSTTHPLSKISMSSRSATSDLQASGAACCRAPLPPPLLAVDPPTRPPPVLSKK
ncbi:hypothetical protein TIFTF001_006104 [Ficus carica]|uniref:Uncharacterized protein n=1 Tax=Ficus carica TaxID=3494 RepID=A0AA87ZHV9_FICCA|nr:hypothetical protein TIFTF001_006104 [Ficus carica]